MISLSVALEATVNLRLLEIQGADILATCKEISTEEFDD